MRAMKMKKLPKMKKQDSAVKMAGKIKASAHAEPKRMKEAAVKVTRSSKPSSRKIGSSKMKKAKY